MESRIRFNPETHQYFFDEKEYPSVTQVIGSFYPFKAFCSEELLERSKLFGSAVHKLIYLYERNDIGEYDYALSSYLSAWVLFRNEHKELDNIIIDIKTGGPSKTHCLQTAGYKILVDEIKQAGYSLKMLEQPLISRIWGFAGTPDLVICSSKIKHRWCVYLSETGYKLEKHTSKDDESIIKSLVQSYNWAVREGIINGKVASQRA